ncbi:unnamed protein product [Linum trigynum]|uniref:Uncharacterized protein n=1 Tax=Linum trigynum TaxID=586398 RepID=A0AAV2D8V1_9ROSI
MLKTTEVILQGLKGNNAPATIIQPEAHLTIGSPNSKQELEQRENKFQTRCLANGKLLSVSIDGKSCTNLVSEYSVKKLGLNEDESIEVTKQAILKFEIGRYKDEVLCDVVPMEEAHVLLGRPWQFDRNGQQDEVTKKYKWSRRGQKFLLKPLSPKEIYEDQLQMQQNLKKEKEFQAKVEEEVKEDVEAKEEVLVDGLTIVTCEEDSQALISSQEEPKLEIEELQEAEEVKEDVLVDVSVLSAPGVEQYIKEPDFDRGDECLEIMEDLPILSKVIHIDYVIGDAILEEAARRENRQEIQRYVKSFHYNGVSIIHGRIVLKKEGIIRSSIQFCWKSKMSGAGRGSKFYKDLRSNLLQERGNDAISTSTILNSRGPKMKIQIRRYKNQLGACLMDKWRCVGIKWRSACIRVFMRQLAHGLFISSCGLIIPIQIWKYMAKHGFVSLISYCGYLNLEGKRHNNKTHLACLPCDAIREGGGQFRNGEGFRNRYRRKEDARQQ